MRDPDAVETSGIYITDPDQENFGFNDPRLVFGESLGFLVNLTVKHGCLFVNEQFLRFGPEHANRAVNFAKVGGPQCALETSFDLNGCTIRLKDYGQPRYGLHAARCTDPQCLATVLDPCYSDLSVADSKGSHCYGRICTKFIALEGRFPDINAALSNVTYLSDPDFNTFYGYSESLHIQVSDNGIMGDAPVTALSHSIRIPITVLPVNDPPVVGRLHAALCTDLFDDGTYDLASTKETERLFAVNPSVDFLDVNEDTVITLLPDRVWIADVDAEEAAIRSANVAKCADACGTVAAVGGCCLESRCPELCEKIKRSFIKALPSEVLVEFRVSSGLVSFYPPPTRSFILGLTMLTNMSLTDIKARGEVKPCDYQEGCMRNQSRIWVRARLTALQQALRWGYLTYVGRSHFNGHDKLEIWVSDDGYSDVTYLQPLSATGVVPITVVAVNNAPSVTFPGGQGCTCREATGICSCDTVPPLAYTKDLKCYNDWIKFGFSDPWPAGSALECSVPSQSSVPNQKETYESYPMLKQNIFFTDVDMNETLNGNITVEFLIGRPNAGDFQMKRLAWTVSYYQWEDADQMTHLRLKGRILDINQQMTELLFNAKDYSGPAPFTISAADNNNYGICKPGSGEVYKCDRAFCENTFSGAALGNLFICGKPVVSPTSLHKFLPGSSMACSDVRLQDQGTGSIVVRGAASTSGPFSCFGCGYYNPATRQVSGTEEDNPSEPGLGRATVDVVIGGATACKFANCTECNAAPKAAAGPHGDGCGWCPSFCGGAGKCMIGKTAPIFETCRADPDSGLLYRQCRVENVNLAPVIGAVVAGALLGFYFLYSLLRWIRRRHGTFALYLKKKRFDITYAGRKLYLLPPDGASYRQFFLMVMVTVALGVFFGGAVSDRGGPFYFQSEFYLDSLVSIAMDLDNCNLRYLPTRNYQFPTSLIAAIKIRFSYLDHPKIRLVSDTCNPASYFKLENTRDPAERYSNFYCSVEVLIPDRVVLPTTSINAIGENVTTVRSGPMDDDTRNFGLEFGANEFRMTGKNLVARIENVSAKHIKYDVTSGSLLATDVTFTPFATFNSFDADMTVTTDKATTVHYWQKSDNLACLSAGTAYIDSACTTQCGFVTSKYGASASDTESKLATDFRFLDRYYRRYFDKSLNGQEAANATVVALTSPPAGVTRRLLQTCAQVPEVPGCIDYTSCSLLQTPKCLCKSSCDLVPPAELDFDGYSGIRGTCDDEGKCCRLVCGGHSRADLFPHPGTVRCGLCVPQDACSPPTCGAWTAGNLEQEWWLTSKTGQISVSVAADLGGRSSPEQHYYRGEPTQPITPSFDSDQKVALDAVFHPGGVSTPNADWFWLRPTGPGVPPRSLGSFVWLSSIRFLVLPDYFLEVVSYGMMNPQKGAASVALRPGFCPTVVKDSDPEMNKRIIQLQKKISDAIQYFPADKPSRPIPFLSQIVWVPVKGSPAVFVLDPSSNQLGFAVVAQWSGMGASTLLIVILTAVVPCVLTSVFLRVFATSYWSYLEDLRKLKIQQENTSVDIYEQAQIAKLEEHDQQDTFEIHEDVIRCAAASLTLRCSQEFCQNEMGTILLGTFGSDVVGLDGAARSTSSTFV
mmetsp:Transcript_8391/g.20427  ORF Transcript_8391/g.20427 Transcript_8391/m.20427 type:complete len:1605 (+) Transcript_8391:4337-9151(+)